MKYPATIQTSFLDPVDQLAKFYDFFGSFYLLGVAGQSLHVKALLLPGKLLNLQKEREGVSGRLKVEKDISLGGL